MNRYRQLVTDRLRHANIFDFNCFVVTIKTKGRCYGNISQQFRQRFSHIEIPDIPYGTSKGPIRVSDTQSVVFTCLWRDEEIGYGYVPHIIAGCTASAIRLAVYGGFERIALPLIGGGQKERMIPHMGEGIDDAFKTIVKKNKDPDDIDVIICVLESTYKMQRG